MTLLCEIKRETPNSLQGGLRDSGFVTAWTRTATGGRRGLIQEEGL